MLLFLQGLPKHPLKCPLELVQDFMSVTKATASKSKRPKKIAINELPENLENLTRPRGGDRYSCRGKHWF